VTKLLIVDDSALMRRLLKGIFEEQGGYQIMTAKNGKEAIELNKTFQPDVITLDINMPEMDGLTALSYIMVERPVPVIMFSSLTEKGALATFEALNMGAVDYVAKPEGTISHNLDAVKKELLYKVRAALRVKVRKNGSRQEKREFIKKISKPKFLPRGDSGYGLVVIGVSTGGPSTLEKILPNIPSDFPWPIVVAQHMPKAFTGPFAKRLDSLVLANASSSRNAKKFTVFPKKTASPTPRGTRFFRIRQPRIQNPESRIQSPESRVQSPETRNKKQETRRKKEEKERE